MLSSLAKGAGHFHDKKTKKTAQPCSGVKQFITGGKNGDVAVVIAIADKAASKKGMSASRADRQPRLIVARLEDKRGRHSGDTARCCSQAFISAPSG